jgi:cobalt/nickel transport system ATP-binding protein
LDLVSRRGLINTLNELNAAGTTIIVSTHDVEALPELADRVIVISRGSVLGEGELHKILQDAALLETAGLEPPTITRLFNELKALGLVQNIPVTMVEAKKQLVRLLAETSSETC